MGGDERLSDEERHAYLAMAERRARPGAGSGENTLRERSARYGTPQIKRHLSGIRFAVVGGLATRLYMPERMTLDADVLIARDEQQRAEEALAASGCISLGPLPVGGSTWRLPDGTNLDVLALDEPWVEAALDTVAPGPGGLPCIALRYLVLMKLAAGRVQDLADITRMLGATDAAGLEAVRAVVREYRPQDAGDLESMIRLGRRETTD